MVRRLASIEAHVEAGAALRSAPPLGLAMALITNLGALPLPRNSGPTQPVLVASLDSAKHDHSEYHLPEACASSMMGHKAVCSQLTGRLTSGFLSESF